MSKKHDQQMCFVKQAMNSGVTSDVVLAALWFRDNKAWKWTTEEALGRFKEWLK